MNDFFLVKHRDLTSGLLEEICKIKSNAWNYSITRQKEWIFENIKDNDVHVFLMRNGEYVAYLNLIQLDIRVESYGIINALGIGSVCAKVKKFGYGSELMSLVNEYLSREEIIAILLCKKELINFYDKFGYKLNGKWKKGIYLMSFNSEKEVEYTGRSF